MPIDLQARIFTEAMAAEVAGFECGSRKFEKKMAAWISGPEALDSIRTRGTTVFLYYAPNGDLVGFGSLGPSEWGPRDGPKIPLIVIPALAIQSSQQGKPDGDEKDKFSHQIMRDLIARARLLGRPILGLFVHPKTNGPSGYIRNLGSSQGSGCPTGTIK